MTDSITLDDELKKNKELKLEDLLNLKDWYLLQAGFPRIPDILLVQFYHSCYYKMELTKKMVDKYLTLRTYSPEIFSDRDPFAANIRDGKPLVHYVFLNNTTNENHRIFISKLLNVDPTAYVFVEAVKSFIMHYDFELYQRGSSAGDVMIIDMEGVTLGHLARLNVVAAKKLLLYIEEAMPFRLIRVHLIHIVPFVDKVMTLLRPLMSKQLFDKLHFHTEGIEGLYEFVPQKLLPKDYGGEDKSLEELTDLRVELLQKNKSWFDEEEKFRIDEAKRPAKKTPGGDMFGVDGSFKKLEFD